MARAKNQNNSKQKAEMVGAMMDTRPLDGVPADTVELIETMLKYAVRTGDTAEAKREIALAVELACESIEEQHRTNDEADDERTIDLIVGSTFKQWRTDTHSSQAEVATQAARAGMSWTRVTVADIERGERRMTATEMLISAALFEHPAVELLTNLTSKAKLTENVTADSSQIRELFTGSSIAPQRPTDWAAARSVLRIPAGSHDWRPAARNARFRD